MARCARKRLIVVGVYSGKSSRILKNFNEKQEKMETIFNIPYSGARKNIFSWI